MRPSGNIQTGYLVPETAANPDLDVRMRTISA